MNKEYKCPKCGNSVEPYINCKKCGQHIGNMLVWSAIIYSKSKSKIYDKWPVDNNG